TDADKSPDFINACSLIAMLHDLDLSHLFEEEVTEKQKTTLGSKHTISETIEKIKAAAEDVRQSAERIRQIVELAPRHCAIEIIKPEGELRLYKQ
ncbi:CBL-interacting serine/threonine-protein kinase 21, partial [Datura stramonium]|nr:CBL-interacting serine/threonine-protein kinase 21 [Datura stramonium]